MNKTEAAGFLEVSVRALERYVAAGRLACRYERGKTGKVAAFDPGDVEAFKRELEAPEVRAVPVVDNARQGAASATAPTSTALAKLDGRANPYGAQLMQALATLATMAPAVLDKPSQAVTVPTEAKLLLTLSEAQALTGLSREVLRAAIDSGALKAQHIGRGWKIKRNDLNLWIDKL